MHAWDYLFGDAAKQSSFMQVRGFPCKCEWPEQCDSQQGSLPPTRMAAKASCLPDQDTTQQQLSAPPEPESSLLSPSAAKIGSSQRAESTRSSGRTAASGPEQGPQDGSAAGHDRSNPALHKQSNNLEQSCGGVRQEGDAAPGSTAATGEAEGDSGKVGSRAATGEVGGDSGKAAQVSGRVGGGQGAGQADVKRLEQEYVHDVYNAIAPHFSSTRFAIWPKVTPWPKCLPQVAVAKASLGRVQCPQHTKQKFIGNELL